MTFALLSATLLVLPGGALADHECPPLVWPPKVCFGMPNTANAGSPPNQAEEANARDNIVPRTVVINAGEWVTFQIAAQHQPTVYQPTKELSEVNVPASGTFINDNSELLTKALVGGVQPTTRPGLTPLVHTDFSVTFTEPGRYLVICNVRGHFLTGMYGWVIVH